MFKELTKLIMVYTNYFLTKTTLTLKQIDDLDYKRQYNLETGEKFNKLIGLYHISDDELLDISETVCRFVMLTRITNIDKYLFLDDKFERPRHPDILDHPERYKDIM